MINEELRRSAMLFGADAIEKLRNSRVIVFGVGGVGGHVCEALARSGVGSIDLVDSDRVSLSNINRQIIALHSTVGRFKTEVMAERIADIDPSCKVRVFNTFYLPENADDIDLSEYDFIVDAIDTVSSKIVLAQKAQELGVSIISSMGTGNKVCPEMLRIADIYKTSVCPLARVMRRELKARGIKKLTVLYSEEEPIKPSTQFVEENEKRIPPASCSFVPSSAGLLIASHVIKSLISK